MKKILFFLFLLSFFTGCSKTANLDPPIISKSNQIREVQLYNANCYINDYCYGEDVYTGDEVEIYVYEFNGDYGYGEDEDGNEVEFYY